MSKSLFNKNIALLQFLTKKCKNKYLLENIINNSEPKFIFLLKTIFNNILGNPIPRKILNKLDTHEVLVRKFFKAKSCSSLKKLLLKKDSNTTQKGGFIGTILSILGAALPTIISLFRKHKK